MNIKRSLTRIVGDNFFFDRSSELESYSRDFSLNPPGMPTYVLQPKNTEEIQEVIRLASEHKIPVITSSSGVHFYGSTLPHQGGIVLDLKRMNRILEIDERNRRVRLEPGVTWGQLQPKLEKQGYMVISPLLPHPSRSVVTTFLEREVPLIPKYEYGEPLLTLEAVLANGEVHRSGSASTPGAYTTAEVAGSYPQGPGVDWFRLFQGAQGTMGVVTWANIKFEYLPKLNKTYFLPFQKLEEAIEPLYRIQRRMIGYECFLLNSFNLATILAEDWGKDFPNLKAALSPWTLILILGGPRRRPEEKIQYEEEALKEIKAQLPGLQLLTSLAAAPGAERKLPSLLRRPWHKETPYWKHLPRGGCQDLFFITTPNKAPLFASAIIEVAAQHGYSSEELGCYLQPIEQARACHLEFSFCYQTGNAAEEEKIRRLHLAAAEAVLKEGAFFSRPYGKIADLVYSRATGYTNALKKVKSLFDPDNIMCPGNLCF